MINPVFLVLGIGITLGIPGYLFSLILFKKLKLIERVCLSVGLSICLLVFLAFLLTVLDAIGIAKISTTSTWISLILISGFLGLVAWLDKARM